MVDWYEDVERRMLLSRCSEGGGLSIKLMFPEEDSSFIAVVIVILAVVVAAAFVIEDTPALLGAAI